MNKGDILKIRKIISIFITISLTITLLCSCDRKEYHEHHVFKIVEESTESSTGITSKPENTTHEKDKTEIESNNTSDSFPIHDIVYYTKSGKCYHYINPCGKGTYYECTFEEAIQKGLTPCDKCVK